jgi:hypothetical protein
MFQQQQQHNLQQNICFPCLAPTNKNNNNFSSTNNNNTNKRNMTKCFICRRLSCAKLKKSFSALFNQRLKFVYFCLFIFDFKRQTDMGKRKEKKIMKL